jgi:hypothetical protein
MSEIAVSKPFGRFRFVGLKFALSRLMDLTSEEVRSFFGDTGERILEEVKLGLGVKDGLSVVGLHV